MGKASWRVDGTQKVEMRFKSLCLFGSAGKVEEEEELEAPGAGAKQHSGARLGSLRLFGVAERRVKKQVVLRGEVFFGGWWEQWQGPCPHGKKSS